ncbi:pinopsin-like [Balearica regulorum gibbericeps]|uniref:pinopsin-like n=1 Tax=Balearica regulorum gibbericeps TaxID=100784 RepID=UPI003F5E6757
MPRFELQCASTNRNVISSGGRDPAFEPAAKTPGNRLFCCLAKLSSRFAERLRALRPPTHEAPRGGWRRRSLGAVGSPGLCSNVPVVLLFWRYRALRSPINLLLLNIAVSDRLLCALGTAPRWGWPPPPGAGARRGPPAPGTANEKGAGGSEPQEPQFLWNSWLSDLTADPDCGNGQLRAGQDGVAHPGQRGRAPSSPARRVEGDLRCGGGGKRAVGTAGIVSLISLAVLSYKRYCTMTGKTEADTTNYRKTWTGIVLSWTYSLVWTAPPLFGWSSYGPEGPGTMCSVNWHSKDANNASYIICLFIFCLVIPFVIIVYSYGKLLCTVRQVSGVNKGTGRSREQRILIMVAVMVICFLLCWLPYATVALIATFGKPGLITPAASVIPSILAKSSTVYNPIIYIFLNKQFYRCFLALLRCNRTTTNSGNKSSSRSCHMLRRAQGDAGPAAESPDPPGNPHPPPEETPAATKTCAGGSLPHLTQAARPTPPAATVFGEFESKRESFAK